jgi:hypothetical protein
LQYIERSMICGAPSPGLIHPLVTEPRDDALRCRGIEGEITQVAREAVDPARRKDRTLHGDTDLRE